MNQRICLKKQTTSMLPIHNWTFHYNFMNVQAIWLESSYVVCGPLWFPRLIEYVEIKQNHQYKLWPIISSLIYSNQETTDSSVRSLHMPIDL